MKWGRPVRQQIVSSPKHTLSVEAEASALLQGSWTIEPATISTSSPTEPDYCMKYEVLLWNMKSSRSTSLFTSEERYLLTWENVFLCKQSAFYWFSHFVTQPTFYKTLGWNTLQTQGWNYKPWVETTNPGLKLQTLGWNYKPWVETTNPWLKLQTLGWNYKPWVETTNPGLKLPWVETTNPGLKLQTLGWNYPGLKLQTLGWNKGLGLALQGLSSWFSFHYIRYIHERFYYFLFHCWTMVFKTSHPR